MLKIREITCKTLLNKSTLSDFTLNCYVGCSHCCIYCYARYMKKFSRLPPQRNPANSGKSGIPQNAGKNRPEEWGEFVDVKINAPEILAKEAKKIKLRGEVFMSSVCDGWQPLEAKYRLSRGCLKILLEAGFTVSILTKSSLILRDFDLLSAYKTPSLGMTITTLDKNLQKALEPYASDAQNRLNILSQAQEKGIKTWVFLGPLIPEFTDTPANLEAIFRAVAGLQLDEIYIDKLNLHWGVLEALKRGLLRYNFLAFRLLLYKCTNSAKYSQYCRQLKENTTEAAYKFNLSNKLTFCF